MPCSEEPANILQFAGRMYLIAVYILICILRRPLCRAPLNDNFDLSTLKSPNRYIIQSLNVFSLLRKNILRFRPYHLLLGHIIPACHPEHSGRVRVPLAPRTRGSSPPALSRKPCNSMEYDAFSFLYGHIYGQLSLFLWYNIIQGGHYKACR